MTPKQIRKDNLKRLKFIEEQADSFVSDVASTQQTVLSNLKKMIASLDVNENGNIKRTKRNINEVQKMRKINRLVITDNYKKEVGDYINKFDKVKESSDQYFKKLPENARV